MTYGVMRVIKTVLTSVIIFYSKRLVYYIDNFFDHSFNDQNMECVDCGNKFKSDVLNSLSTDRCVLCEGHLIKIENNRKNDEYGYRK